MANKYTFGNTIDALMEEEDRECQNECLRAQQWYYSSAAILISYINSTISKMTDEEKKQMLMNGNLINPIIRK